MQGIQRPHKANAYNLKIVNHVPVARHRVTIL
jgi:hypothetical protein